MRNMPALALIVCLLAQGMAHAQEKPHKGVDAGAQERRVQTRSSDQQRLLTTALDQAQEVMRQRGALSAQQMTDAFLVLDKNRDGALSRSELPAQYAGLRAAFSRFDSDQDHRLTYSEFCHYLDVAPEDVRRLLAPAASASAPAPATSAHSH